MRKRARTTTRKKDGENPLFGLTIKIHTLKIFLTLKPQSKKEMLRET